MDGEQLRVDGTLLILPTEILVYIISLVTPLRERMKLRYVSWRLQTACETPSLWREFVWPYYHTGDEVSVINLLKTFGQHVKQLSFPDQVLPRSKLVSTLSYCSNAVHLSLPSVGTLDIDDLEEMFLSMKQLQSLNIQWECDIKELLARLLELITSCSIKLKELTLSQREIYPISTPSESGFITVVEPWLHYWTTKGFVPRKLNLVFVELYDIDMLGNKLLLESYKSISNPLVSGSGELKVYISLKMPLDLVPVLPVLQVEFGQIATLPCVNAGIHGFSESGWLLLTHAALHNKEIYKAFLQRNPLVVQGNHTFNLEIITDFNACYCDMYSHQLEQLAITCPKLQRLNLYFNNHCLESLRGLHSIASSCHNLQGLNLSSIATKDIESQMQLWEILSEMKLTHLAIHLCVLLPSVEEDRMELIGLFQKCKSLQALEFNVINSCDSCMSVFVSNSLVLSHFHALIHLQQFSGDDNYCPTALHNIVTSCNQLKYLIFVEEYIYHKTHYTTQSPVYPCNLEQLYIESENLELPDDFMASISAHGGLVHVVLYVRSITSEGITVMVMNSPNLLTCHVFIDTFELLDKNLEAALKKKLLYRKLFEGGSYQVGEVRSVLASELKEKPCGDLLSFWQY